MTTLAGTEVLVLDDWGLAPVSAAESRDILDRLVRCSHKLSLKGESMRKVARSASATGVPPD